MFDFVQKVSYHNFSNKELICNNDGTFAANRHSFPHHALISSGWQMMALSTDPINVMTLRHTEDPMLWLTTIFIIDNCPSLYLYAHQCNSKLKMDHLSKLEIVTHCDITRNRRRRYSKGSHSLRLSKFKHQQRKHNNGC